MNRFRYRFPRTALLWMLLVFSFTSCGRSDVDAELVGEWQLKGASPAIYWKIRSNGTYQVSGPGAGAGHSGSFSAADGKWFFTSEAWGKDQGTYQLPDANTLLSVGKLGAGTWVRTSPVKNAKNKKPGPSKGDPRKLKLGTQNENGKALPKDIPELTEAATKRAREWKKDAAAVSIQYDEVNAPNMKGPQVRYSFISPSEGTGFMITVTTEGAAPYEFKQKVNWGENPLPPVFIDFPVAVERARKDGMQGAVISGSLRIYEAQGMRALAWIISAASGGRTVDGATGEIIQRDVTGYIDYYNAQWERAARALRALLGVRGGGGYSPPTAGSSSSSESGGGYQGMTSEEYQQSVAESNAYWGGSSDDYNRVKNGECTWSDSSNYGC